MDMMTEAFAGLFPEKEADYDFSMRYSGRFKGFNANVRKSGRKIDFSLSRNWRPVSRDIKMGLLQELLTKLFPKWKHKSSNNIDLYHIFLKKVHIAVPKVHTDPLIEESFDRVNERFFSGMIEKPNFRWTNSRSKLGSYDFGADTIMISEMLRGKDDELMDYVMYHEMLHKQQKFKRSGKRTTYHSSEFRRLEKLFPGHEDIERRLMGLRPRRISSKPAAKGGFWDIFGFFS